MGHVVSGPVHGDQEGLAEVIRAERARHHNLAPKQGCFNIDCSCGYITTTVSQRGEFDAHIDGEIARAVLEMNAPEPVQGDREALIESVLTLLIYRHGCDRYGIDPCEDCREQSEQIADAVLASAPWQDHAGGRVASAALAISHLLDASYAPGTDPELILWRRLTKVSEEAGEVQNALRGLTGENPRKGITHTRDDVITELLDCAGAALGGVAHLTGDASSMTRLAERLEYVLTRLGGDPAERDGDRPEPVQHSVLVEPSQYVVLQSLVERSEGTFPASVESLVGIALDAFIEGAK